MFDGGRVGDLVWLGNEGAMPDAAIRTWAANAEPGASIVYARGAALPASAGVDLVRSLAQAGAVAPVRRKMPHGFDFIAQRTRSPFALQSAVSRLSRGPVRRARKVSTKTECRALYRILKKCAAEARVCPTNAELAKALGLKDAKTVSNRLLRVVAAGLVKFTDFGPNERRVALIVESGAQTPRGAL